jgi:hypothetical protein
MRAAAVAILLPFSRPASARLLQKVTAPVQSTLGAITCPALRARTQLDDAVRTCVEGGAAVGVIRAILFATVYRSRGIGLIGISDSQHFFWGTTAGPEGTVWGNIAPVVHDKGSPPDGV